MHLSLLDSERKIHMSEMQNHTVHFSFDTTPEQAAIIQQKMKNMRDGAEWLSIAA